MIKKVGILSALAVMLLSSCGSNFRKDTEANVKAIAANYSLEVVSQKFNSSVNVDITFKIDKCDGMMFKTLSQGFLYQYVFMGGVEPPYNYEIGKKVDDTITFQRGYHLINDTLDEYETHGGIKNQEYYSAGTKIGFKGDINPRIFGFKDEILQTIDFEKLTMEYYSNDYGLIESVRYDVSIKEGANQFKGYATQKFNWKLKI